MTDPSARNPSERDSLIDRLAEQCGILPSYVDIAGNRQRVSRRTKARLLTAMGYATDNEETLRAALAARHARRWTRQLPPVLVVEQGEQPAVELTLPASPGDDHRLRYRLWLEEGEQRTGELDRDRLERLEVERVEGVERVRYRLVLPLRPPLGYHELTIEPTEDGGEPSADERMTLIVVPAACYEPPALGDDGRVWGPAVQLYALRSHRNWGVGDFSDLTRLVEICGRLGAAVIGLNPLHALFPRNPAHCSPYSPSSRMFLNVLYLDVTQVAELAECEPARRAVREPDFQARLQALRSAELIDYRGVAEAKLSILELLFEHFREHHLDRDSERAQRYRRFCSRQGEALQRHALFCALHEHFIAESPESGWSWRSWPAPYRDPISAEVARFADEHEDRVALYRYLQWLADEQLGAAGRRSFELGLGIGLYTDLAVSEDPSGAEVWSHGERFVTDVSIGAPPDTFSPAGQSWGIVPWHPERLREAAYRPFAEALRRNMRHAGALRLDHAMGLMRLFWVPKNAEPADGAYVAYPLDDLLGIVALESHRASCMVIGEALGTVPAGLRERLAARGVFSYRLLLFERDERGGFAAPAAYPERAAAAVSTHDLPTFAGFWAGRDLQLREALGLFPSPAARGEQIVERARDRARLLLALEHEGLLPAGASANAPPPPSAPGLELSQAVHTFLARSPSRVMLLQLEDLLGELEQPNLPGTLNDQHPNWQRKLALTLERLDGDDRVRAVVAQLRALRAPRPGAPRDGGPALCDGGAALPTSTYRMQLHRGFGFADAEGLVPYLDRLGVSHLYTSPLLRARPGSPHGYDIIDHGALNPEIGSPEAFDRLVERLHQHGMGLVMDIVPNHVGVMGSDNRWWLDVLENGQASVRADYFDVAWRPAAEALRGKVLLPILGCPYGDALAAGELRLEFDAERGELSVHYYEHRFPLNPARYPALLGHEVARLESLLAGDGAEAADGAHATFRSLVDAFGQLPDGPLPERARLTRDRDKEVHKQRLAELCAASPALRQYLLENVALFNGSCELPLEENLLHQLLEQQPYRLAYWRVASDEINYRRFFDVNELAGVRVEDPEVFARTHRLIHQLIARRQVDGLRVDHPDGLHDPARYFANLQQLALQAQRASADDDGAEPPLLLIGDGEPDEPARAIYVVAEKILADHEALVESWPVHGTTGYDFTNAVNGLFVDGGAEAKMTRLHEQFVGERADFGELVYRRKKLIMEASLDSELAVLANELDRISESHPRTRDFTRRRLRRALMEIIACFPVYRTYVTDRAVSADDRRYVEWAVAQARKRNPAGDPSIYDFIGRVLLLEWADEGDPLRDAAVRFAMKVQQYTGPVMAKSLEDTTFYSYGRLVSLNEVGGNPSRFGLSVVGFHKQNQERAQRWPAAMLCTSTHDTKRSEDVRTRIDALSELPDAWRGHLVRWGRLNRQRKRLVDDSWAPCREDEYLLYQTLVGAWPLALDGEPQLEGGGLEDFRQRITQYALKAAREAKLQTSWIHPHPAYEEALVAFVDALLAPRKKNAFVADLVPFARRVARIGALSSLAQVVLKGTSPGVPDFYQGSELWDLSLVDPDNRRPVDYDGRRAALEALTPLTEGDEAQRAEGLAALLARADDGRLKLFVTTQTLRCRRALPPLFVGGDYIPLTTSGERGEKLCAFARQATIGETPRHALVVAPRLIGPLIDAEGTLHRRRWWEQTLIDLEPLAPRGGAGLRLVNAFTGAQLTLAPGRGPRQLGAAELLGGFPVALWIDRPQGNALR